MITSTPAARRGRPRAFDREAALEKAMQAFWARGYDGTSRGSAVILEKFAKVHLIACF